MEAFNFYFEAMGQYDLIVPAKVEGLILISLYQKFGDESFSEEQIYMVINKVHIDLGKSTKQVEYDRNNSIIIRLQEFFLWRDETRKRYSFKSYGKHFCEKIVERLRSRYNPARIKRLFDTLIVDLQRHLSTEELTFDLWFDEHFDVRKSEIADQVEILDQQVSESVATFKKTVKGNHQDIAVLLDQMIHHLDEIKDQVIQLKDAFKSTYVIDNIVEDLIVSATFENSGNKVQSVFGFNSNIRGQLEQVSQRIERIKPRIREFIYEFNQRDFDRKTNLFIDFMLQNSKQVKIDGSRKKIYLPGNVPDFAIYSPSLVPKLIIIPEKNIAPKSPVEVIYRTVNKERQQILLRKAQQKLVQLQRINFWYAHLVQILQNGKEINFSSLFFEIMISEKGNISIPIKLTHKIIRTFSRSNEYRIDIKREIQKNQMYPNLSLWRMLIQRNPITHF